MIVQWQFINSLNLDAKYELLNAKSTLMVYEMFKALDWNQSGGLDDIQFYSLLTYATDLKKTEIFKIFDLLDLDGSGSVEFDEFYLLICILTAVKNGEGKAFLFQNWKTCFEILDADGSGEVSINEFQTLGFLFGFSSSAISKIYEEFHFAGRQELDQSDFQLFVLAAVELQGKLDKRFQTEKEDVTWKERLHDWLDTLVNKQI